MYIRSVDSILKSKIASIQSRLPAGVSLFSSMLASSMEAMGTQESGTGQTMRTQANSIGQNAVEYAQQFLGTPYAFGASDLMNGTDCSGFVQSVYKTAGIELPRTAYQQSQVGQSISLNELIPGDLLFFKTSDRAPITHVGMYMGDNQFIHSSISGNGVGISNLNERWKSVLKAQRRVTT